MSVINFIKKYNVPNSFRNQKIINTFDLKINEVIKEYDVNIDIENKDWNIGCIVGSSGTGKTTILNELFNNDKYYIFNGFNWDNKKSILDNFNENINLDDIIKILSSIGFNTPVNWLLPYNLLSNGQKMRVDLARCILEKKNRIIVFDEFTSVVDRQVAQCCCICLSKYIRNNNLKVIFVSCHFDILDYLEQDWIFNTNDMSFKYGRSARQEKRFTIKRGNIENWKYFKGYYYLSSDICKNSKVFELYDNEKIIGFCAVLHLPNKNKNYKRIHRIVILPDYQGLGLGTRFLNEIAKYYYNLGYEMFIETSNISFIFSLNKNVNWILKDIRQVSKNSLGNLGKIKNCIYDRLRKIVSFKYINKSN